MKVFFFFTFRYNIRGHELDHSGIRRGEPGHNQLS